MTTDSATLAAKVMLSSQLAASGRAPYAYQTVRPLFGSEEDSWRFLVGLFSVMRPSIPVCEHGRIPEIRFTSTDGTMSSVACTALAQIANPFFRAERASARTRWSVAFSYGLGPDVLGAAVVGAGACLASRYAAPPTP